MRNPMARRSARPARHRGVARWLLTGGLAAALGGGTLHWQVAGWRVEKTEDGLRCGIEKDLLRLTGSTLARAESEREACEALVGKLATSCPLFTSHAVERCRPIVGAERVETQMLITPLGRARARLEAAQMVLDTGPAAKLAGYGRQMDVWMHPYDTDASVAHAAVYRLASSTGQHCLGVKIGGDIITAGHCVSGGKPNFTAGCESSPGFFEGVDYACTLLDSNYGGQDCSTTGAQPNPRDIARCRPKKAAAACFEAAETAQWTKPEPAPTKVWVVGDVDGELGFVAATPDPDKWPAAPGPKGFVLAALAGSTDPGDSGGPAFDGKEVPRRVIGINTCPDSALHIVPLYLWKTEIASN